MGLKSISQSFKNMNAEERENVKEKEQNIFIHEVTNNLIPLTQSEKFKL